MGKIKRVIDLPEWFDLEKYKGIESFRAKEWYQQLSRRKWLLLNNPEYPTPQRVTRPIFEKITYKDESGIVIPDGALLYAGNEILDTADAMADWRQSVGEAARKLRANPLACGPEEQIDDEYITTAQPVASMTISDLRGVVRQGYVTTVRSGTPTLRDYIDTFEFDELPEDVKNETIWYHPSAMNSVTKAAILINLNASDAKIREAFEIWLKEARASQQISTKPRTPLYTDWKEYGVLPYLDLKIWSMETDTRISDEVMAEAVTPNRGVDVLRRTTKKHGKELMLDLSELLALAAAEE